MTEASASSIIPHSEPSNSNWESDCLVSENVPNDASVGCNNFVSSPCKSTNELSREEMAAQSIQEDSVVSSFEGKSPHIAGSKTACK